MFQTDKQKKINFCLTGDKNYLPILKVVITSILENLNKDVSAEIFIITKDCDNIELLKSVEEDYNAKVVHYKYEDYSDFLQNISDKHFKNKYINIVCYFRLLMFKILPENVDKCFYIDGDMIINCDLAPMYMSMQDELAFAVPDITANTKKEYVLSHCHKIPEFKNLLENPRQYPYFNAGFLLLNIKLAKELDIFKQILDIMEKYPELPYADQDILNIILGQKYNSLIKLQELSYNIFCEMDYKKIHKTCQFYTKQELYQICKKIKNYHYVGENKPWKNGAKHYNRVWWKYYKKTKGIKIKNTNRTFIDKISLLLKLVNYV